MMNLTRFEGVASVRGEGMIVLDCTDSPRQHWIVDYTGKTKKLTIALNVNQTDIEPKIYERNNLVFLGAEQGIYVISLNTGEVIEEISDATYVQWVEKDSNEFVIFAAEDEVIVLNNYGKLIWRKSLPDVIEATDIEGCNLSITDFTGEHYNYSLIDGDLK